MATKYTKELLAPIVASSGSLAEVMRKLGLTPNGGNHRHISASIRTANLDTSHFGSRHRRTIESVGESTLRDLVMRSRSYAQVLVALGLPPAGRPQRELVARIAALGINTDHLRGHGWSRGETTKSNATVARSVAKRTRPDEDVFVANSRCEKGPALVKRLLARGWPYQCAICGISEWQGKFLVLHLDHKNGIHNDNRLTNLRLVCPNCHSQTDTYCNRPKPARIGAADPRAYYLCYTSAVSRACRNR